MKNFYLIAALTAFSSARALKNKSLTCHEFNIPVDTETVNLDSSTSSTGPALGISFGAKAVSETPFAVTRGNFTIHGRYCEPENDVRRRRHTLQVLVHGATYTVDYWSGLAPPGTRRGQDKYSWIVYASKQGYPTLSLDRPCNGKSSRPNGTTVCQESFESQTIHEIIKGARSGTLPGMTKKFSKIIYVGHSYGSLVGNGMTKQYPKSLDAFIATGFTLDLSESSGGASDPGYRPAQDVQPKKWGFLNDPAYLIATSSKGTRDLFYFGSYKKSEAHYDYLHRQTVTQGELESSEMGQKHAPNFRGSIFVLNGNDDAVFCATQKGSGSGNRGNCSNGNSLQVGKGYPNALVFEYYNTANTGHCLNLHTSAQESFRAAHYFLSKVGF